MRHQAMTMLTSAALLATAIIGVAEADEGRWSLATPDVVTDTLTGIQWTRHDNQGDITWDDARAHCANLALDGGGWALPTPDELSQLHAGAQGNAVPCGDSECSVPQAFQLTGPWFWSIEQGKSPTEARTFTLSDGYRAMAPVSSSYNIRALCLRRRS